FYHPHHPIPFCWLFLVGSYIFIIEWFFACFSADGVALITPLTATYNMGIFVWWFLGLRDFIPHRVV
ncbi:hypothetical protein, partial [Enterobacter mori]